MCTSREQVEDISNRVSLTYKYHIFFNFFHIFLQVLSTGGEGLILRDPKAGYLHGYSPFLYKHKVTLFFPLYLYINLLSQGFRDAEALVLKQISDTTYLCRVYAS